MRVFKTIEVHKSPLTAMALHNCAPIIASGSHKQFIKILTFGGEQLSMIRFNIVYKIVYTWLIISA
jgi:regulator-associated protein of mTOR